MAGFLAGSSLSSCAGIVGKNLEETLRSDHYAELTKNWDPIYGPPLQWFSRYGGPGDFEGHIHGGATPGLDYDVLKGTPLVPPMMSYARQITRDPNGVLYILLMNAFNPAYRISLGHIEDALIDERYIISGDVMRYLGKRMRAIGREEIVALSGNSGLGPREYGWVQPPHLHLSLYYWNDEKRILESLDPEKNGIDGGRPVFWDGKVFLDTRPEKRLSVLEKALVDVREEVGKWQKARDLQEVGATLTEYSNLLGNAKGKEILDSKHFQDMRSLLKRITLEEKKYLPGTAPYSLMLKIVGYSTDAKQDVILTLPFIAASLEKTYKKTEYENGPFLTINTIQE